MGTGWRCEECVSFKSLGIRRHQNNRAVLAARIPWGRFATRIVHDRADRVRNFTRYLEAWDQLEKLLRR